MKKNKLYQGNGNLVDYQKIRTNCRTNAPRNLFVDHWPRIIVISGAVDLDFMFSCETERILRSNKIYTKSLEKAIQKLWYGAGHYSSWVSIVEAVTKCQMSYGCEKTVNPYGRYSAHSCWGSILPGWIYWFTWFATYQCSALSEKDVAVIRKFSFCKVRTITIISKS